MVLALHLLFYICSTGVGRTGVFIAVDWLMQQMRHKTDVNIFQTVIKLRNCRMNMVQNVVKFLCIG